MKQDLPWLRANGAIGGAVVKQVQPIYNYKVSVESTLSAILGRQAAYQNREVTWEEMLKSNERWEEKSLKLAW